MAQLDDVLEKKIQELDEMSITDDSFKDAARAVSDLAETNAKVEGYKSEKKSNFWKIVLGILGLATPFAVSAMDHKAYDRELDKVLEYEKTGGIMSSGSRSVLSGLKFKK